VNWTSRASNATYYDVNGTLKKSSYNLLLQSEDFSTTWATVGARVTITTNQIASPNGQTTADLAVPNTTTNDHILYQSVSSIIANSTYTYTIYAKASGYSHIQLFYGSGFNNLNAWANFNLSGSGSIGFEGTDITATIESLPNGWYRCRATATSGSSVSNPSVVLIPLDSDRNSRNPTFTGDGTSGIYLWGAQLETGTYAGDYAKTEGSAASTARTAAYLPDGNGNFVSAGDLLLEGAGTNQLDYSESFNNWSQVNATLTLNYAIAPDGTNTATLVTGSGSSYGGLVRKNPIAYVATENTLSVYAKAGTHDTIGLRITNDCIETSNNNAYARFNLVTGVVTTITPRSGTINQLYMENVGDGWYRCVITYTPAAGAGSSLADVALVDSSTGNHTYNGTGNVLLWGAQFEHNAYPTSYIQTTGSTATRAADVSTSTSAATFGNSWYEQSEGTIYADLVTTSRGHNGYPRLIGTFGSNIDATNEFAIYTRNIGTGDDYKFYGVITDGVTAGDFNTPAGSPVGSGKVAFAAKVNDGAFAVSGLTPTTDNTLGMNTATQLLFFSNARYQPRTSGYIRRLTYWPSRLSNDTLQTITV
jgi:hypothetical protein